MATKDKVWRVFFLKDFAENSISGMLVPAVDCNEMLHLFECQLDRTRNAKEDDSAAYFLR